MAEEDIDLKLSVDDTDLIASLNRAEREVEQLGESADQAGKEITSAFKKSEKAVNDFGKEAEQASAKAAQATKKVSRANDDLASKLRQFRKESGLVLLGVAGAALGAAASVEQLVNRFVPLIAIQQRVTDAAQDAITTWFSETRQLKQLTDAINDETKSTKQRETAKKALIEQYKDYLPNIDKDLEKTGGLVIVNTKLKEAIRQRAVEQAKAAIQEKLVSDLGIKILEQRQKEVAAIQSSSISGVFSAFQRGQSILAGVESTAIKTQLTLIETVGKDIDEVLKSLEKEEDLFSKQTALTTEEIEKLAEGSKKAAEKTKPLEGSLAALEAELKKVNDQIREQTNISDSESLAPLIAKAQQLEEAIQKANEQLERLKSPTTDIPVVGSIDAVVTSFDELEAQLEDNAKLQEARLKEAQTAELLRLKQSQATEQEITEAQKLQEIERQKLALETEQKRLQFILQYGTLRSQAEKEAIQSQLNAITNELEAFNTKAATEGKQRKSFFEILGIDPNTEEGAKAIEGIQQGVQIAVDNLQKLFDAQVQFADQQVQRREQNISRLQTQLALELQLQEQGFANNTKLVQKQLAEENKAREKALADQRKAKREQLILETITQAASLVSASAQIFNSFASLPFGVGIPIAAGVVAAMIGSFIALKVKAFQAVDQRFSEGGLIPSEKNGGRSDKHGGRGHRVEDTNIILGGGEFVMNAKDTAEHLDLMERINDGEYAGVDIIRAIEASKSINAKVAKYQIQIQQQREFDYYRAIKDAVSSCVEPYLKAIVQKPSYAPTDDGYMVAKTDLKGNNTVSMIKTKRHRSNYTAMPEQ